MIHTNIVMKILTTVGKPEFQEVVLTWQKNRLFPKNDKDLLHLKKTDKKIAFGALANDKTSPLGS
jgi:hypothetical protein